MTLPLPGARRRGAAGLVPVLLLAAMVAVLLAACGSASGTGNDGVLTLASPSASPGASGAPAASVDPEDAMQAFSECMKDHGIDVQVAVAIDGGTSGTIGGPALGSSAPGTAAEPQTGTGKDFDPEAMAAADKACRDLLPSGIGGDPNATIPPEQVEQMLAFAKCMREHGVNMPDPQFNGNGMTVQIGGPAGGDDAQGIDPMSQAFQDAQEACAKDMPGGGPFVVGGTSSESRP